MLINVKFLLDFVKIMLKNVILEFLFMVLWNKSILRYKLTDTRNCMVKKIGN